MQPIVRLATQNDIPVLLEFEQGLIQAERSMDPTIKDGSIIYYNISNLIKSDDSDVYVVELDSKIVASGYAEIRKDRYYLKHTHQGYLGFMFVSEEHRGNGYNKLIMNALLQWCKERNIHEIRLDVYDVNDSAIRAYEKVGFTKHMINMRLEISDMES